MYRHVYVCRTLGNTLKLLALWGLFALTVVVQFRIGGYFRRVALIPPFVNGRSLPEAAIKALLLTINIGTLLPAAPNLAQWLFLHLETSRDSLHYRFWKGRGIVRGQAEWSQVTVIEGSNGALLRVPGQQFHIPLSLSHYQDFLRQVQANRPAPSAMPQNIIQKPSLSDLMEPNTRQQVQAEIDAGRKIQAIKIVREYTDFGLKQAKDFVEQWAAEGKAPAEPPAPAPPPTPRKLASTVAWAIGSYFVQVWLQLYV